MNLMKAIKERRSVRVFQDKVVPKERIDDVIEAASYAPSACNQQLWKFVVITDQKIKDLLVNEAKCGKIIQTSPVVIAVFYVEQKGMDRFTNYMSASAAIQNMLLRAYELGLGACWISYRGDQLWAEEILGLSSNDLVELISFVVLGYPAEHPKPPEKRDLKEIMCKNIYNFLEPEFWGKRDYAIRQTSPEKNVYPYGTWEEFDAETSALIGLVLDKKVLFYLPYDGTHLFSIIPFLKDFRVHEVSKNAQYFLSERAKHFTTEKLKFVGKLKKESEDCIVCSQQLETFPSFPHHIHEIARTLKPNGRFVISFRNNCGWFSFEQKTLNYFKMKQCLEGAGLKVVREFGISPVPIFRGIQGWSKISKIVVFEAKKQ